MDSEFLFDSDSNSSLLNPWPLSMTPKETYHLSCMTLSCCSNAFLIYLILFKSPSKLGNYKYLMVYTSVFEAFYAILDFFVKPFACSFGYAWFVIRLDSGMNPSVSELILVIWCGLFGVSQAIFAVHFIYRYGAMHKKFYSTYLSGSKILILFFIPIIIGLYWGCATYYPFIPNHDNREYMRSIVYKLTGENIDFMSYICAKFYYEDPNGKMLKFDGRVWFGLGNLWVMVCASMFCVFYLGPKCYRKIHSQLEVLQNIQSTQTARLQQQLFFALVAQTFIPLIFMYIPCTILFFSAVFDLDIGEFSSLVTYTITLYPVVDPLPNMVIIKSYRKAIRDMLISCITCCEHQSNEEVTVRNDQDSGSRIKTICRGDNDNDNGESVL